MNKKPTTTIRAVFVGALVACALTFGAANAAWALTPAASTADYSGSVVITVGSDDSAEGSADLSIKDAIKKAIGWVADKLSGGGSGGSGPVSQDGNNQDGQCNVNVNVNCGNSSGQCDATVTINVPGGMCPGRPN